MKRLIVYLFVVSLLSSCTFFNFSKDDEVRPEIITGRLYFMGNEPNVDIGLSSFDSRTYVLIFNEETSEEAGKLQNQIVTVKGLVDSEIKFPQKSIYIDEYKKTEILTVTGKLTKTGLGERASYFVETKDGDYILLSERIIQVNNFVDKTVDVKGYFYLTNSAYPSIYLIDISKNDADKKKGIR